MYINFALTFPSCTQYQQYQYTHALLYLSRIFFCISLESVEEGISIFIFLKLSDNAGTPISSNELWGMSIFLKRGCNLSTHSSVHASFVLRRGLTRFQLPWDCLGPTPENSIECRNSSYILEWGPGALQKGNTTLIAPNHLSTQIEYL